VSQQPLGENGDFRLRDFDLMGARYREKARKGDGTWGERGEGRERAVLTGTNDLLRAVTGNLSTSGLLFSLPL
jgi:hypothetical protein